MRTPVTNRKFTGKLNVDGKKFSSAIKPLISVMGFDGYLYVKGSQKEKEISLSAVGKSGSFFFETKILKLDGVGEGISDDIECCLSRDAGQHFNKILTDTKITSFEVSCKDSSFDVLTSSLHKIKTREEKLVGNTSIPILEKIPKTETNIINKAIDSFSKGEVIKANCAQLRDAFSVTVSSTAQPGTKPDLFMECVHFCVKEGNILDFFGTDGVRASLYTRKFDGAPQKSLIGNYAIGYHLANFLSKHLNSELTAEIGVVSGNTIVFKSEDTILGGVLVEVATPQYEKVFSIKTDSSVTIDKSTILGMLNSVFSFVEGDSYHKRACMKLEKGMLSLVNPKKPKDYRSGLSVDYAKKFSVDINTEKFSSLLRTFRGSKDIIIGFNTDGSVDHLVFESKEDENVKGLLVQLSPVF